MMLRWRAWMFLIQQRLMQWPVWVSWLIGAALIAVIVSIYAGLSYLGKWQDRSGPMAEVRQLQQERSALQNERDAIRNRINNPEIPRLQQQITALEQDLAGINGEIERITGQLVSPEDMARLLRGLLAQQPNLQLVALNNLPVESAGSQAPASLYRHGMEIQLRGTYNGIAAYVRAIEQLPQQVFVGELEFEIQQYPTGNARLRLYTLSDREEWLNV